MNFTRITRELRRYCFAAEGLRIANERRAINASELQRLVILNAIALVGAFHFNLAFPCAGLNL